MEARRGHDAIGGGDAATGEFAATWWKRPLDLTAGAVAMLILLPVFACLAVMIRIDSPGSVFFRQERVGQHGKPFTFLKFRSMYIDNDPSLHKDYVRKLIAGNAERKPYWSSAP